MKFDQMLMELQMEIERQYGFRDAVTKIGISREAYSAITMDLRRRRYESITGRLECTFTMGDAGELKVCGVEVVARDKDNF